MTVSGVALHTVATSVLGYNEVYNFEVGNTHTYFAGTTNGGVWVHNVCTTLTRFGEKYEDAAKLNQDAADAEAAGFPFGVSAIGDATRPGPTADFNAVSDAFNVIKTGRGAAHYTIELPNPVTDEVAATFNQLFGRVP